MIEEQDTVNDWRRLDLWLVLIASSRFVTAVRYACGGCFQRMRVTGLVTLLWWGVLTWLSLRTVHERSGLTSFGITIASLLVMIVVTALLVR